MIPNLSNVIRRFEQTMQFQIVKKTVVDHDVEQTSFVRPPLWFEGTLQPLKETELLVKPEGERKFKWYLLFTDIIFDVDTVIKDMDGNVYRIMNSSNWADAGVSYYQIIEGLGVPS